MCLLTSNACIIYVLLPCLFIDIKHIKITGTETKWTKSEHKNLKLFIYFFNKDISLNITLIRLRFSIHVNKGQLEGRVSQILYLGPGSNFMKS